MNNESKIIITFSNFEGDEEALKISCKCENGDSGELNEAANFVADNIKGVVSALTQIHYALNEENQDDDI